MIYRWRKLLSLGVATELYNVALLRDGQLKALTPSHSLELTKVAQNGFKINTLTASENGEDPEIDFSELLDVSRTRRKWLWLRGIEIIGVLDPFPRALPKRNTQTFLVIV